MKYVVFLFVCFSSFAKTDSSLVQISLLGLNDTHGSIEARDVVLGSPGTEKKAKISGLATISSYLKAARNQNPKGTLILDSGDVYQGSLLSNFFQGFSIVDAYNELQVNATTFGNHEFDFGDLKPEFNSNGQLPHPQGSAIARIQKSKYYTLSANVFRVDNGTVLPLPGSVPSKIIIVNGIKVGLIGVTTLSTSKEASPVSIEGLLIKPLIEVVPQESEKLKKQGAQLIVLMSHAGGKCDMSMPPEAGDLACSPEDEITKMIDAIPPGSIDAVFAGHTHLRQAHFIRGIPVVQTMGFGTSFSRVDFWLPKNANPKESRKNRIERMKIHSPTYYCQSHFAHFNSCNPDDSKAIKDLGAPKTPTYFGQNIVPDAEIEKVLIPYQKQVEVLKNRKVVESLPRELPHDRTKESLGANCLADVILRATNENRTEKADFFLSHSGGIRSGWPSGLITYEHIYRILPFDGGAIKAKLTGEELEKMGQLMSISSKSVAVVSSGWKVKLANQETFPQPRHRGFLDPDGKTLDMKKKYTIVTEEFNTQAGGYLDEVFKRVRADNELESLAPITRDFVADDLIKRGNSAMPPSCLGEDPKARIEFVD